MKLSRRDLCRGALTAAATLTIVPRSVLAGSGHKPPSEKINVAVIGTGSQGMRHVQALLARQPAAQVVAVCDVNRTGSDYFDLESGVAGLEPARQMVEIHHAQ